MSKETLLVTRVPTLVASGNVFLKLGYAMVFVIVRAGKTNLTVVGIRTHSNLIQNAQNLGEGGRTGNLQAMKMRKGHSC